MIMVLDMLSDIVGPFAPFFLILFIMAILALGAWCLDEMPHVILRVIVLSFLVTAFMYPEIILLKTGVYDSDWKVLMPQGGPITDFTENSQFSLKFAVDILIFRTIIALVASSLFSISIFMLAKMSKKAIH